jgi:hypothetical protein
MVLKWNAEHEKSKDKNYDESVYTYMWYTYIWEYFHCKFTHVMKFVAWELQLFCQAL